AGRRGAGLALVAAAAMLWFADAAAQQFNPSTTTTSPIERVLPTPQPHAAPRLIAPPEGQAESAEEGARGRIGTIERPGSTVYGNDELVPYYAGVSGKPVAQGRVAQIVRDMQTRYRNDGYFLTVVHGAVDQTNGVNVLRVRVVEGFISDV